MFTEDCDYTEKTRTSLREKKNRRRRVYKLNSTAQKNQTKTYISFYDMTEKRVVIIDKHKKTPEQIQEGTTRLNVCDKGISITDEGRITKTIRVKKKKRCAAER